MAAFLLETLGFLKGIANGITVRRDRSPLRTFGQIFEFASTRAAFVTQKKLYGYLKTRMGTRFPSMFENDDFVASINIAKMQVFAASLADMSIFVVANGAAAPAFDNDARAALALRCYEAGLDANDDGEQVPENRADWIAAFRARLAKTVWEPSGNDSRHFTQSPGALVRWAPIADHLKKYDVEIVENSIRFAWQEVRREFMARLDRDAIAGAREDAEAAAH